MYRFARTYGFVHFSYSDHDNSGGTIDGNTNDELKQDERHGTSNGPNLEPGAASSKDSLRLELPAPSAPLIVPVRLADVATAPLAAAGGVAGVEVESGSSAKGASAPVGTRASAESTACEKRLRRYPTSAEEDLSLLRRLSNKACVLSEEENKPEGERRGPPGAGSAKSAASLAISGAVTAEWVQMCIALRAAEKIALERELRGRTPPLD